jgi:glycine reductase
MYPENPGVDEYRKDIFIARASDNVMGMEPAMQKMVALGLKLVRHETPWPEEDDYIAQGRRKNFFDTDTGARRAVNMLLKKLRGEPFESEYPMPTFDRVAPAPAIEDIRQARLALVTSGGIVPRGNPDRIEAASAQRFGTYSLRGLQTLTSQTHQTAHGGYDPTFANENPNRVLPLDVVRDLEAEGAIGSLHEHFYATVGNSTSVANAKKFGESIAQNLLADGVQAVILTST